MFDFPVELNFFINMQTNTLPISPHIGIVCVTKIIYSIFDTILTANFHVGFKNGPRYEVKTIYEAPTMHGSINCARGSLEPDAPI